ncbi:MAG: hypothetical protein Q8865_10090 [Bacillota bacterium]|nr:hypothetical protein [Bacillota bacterium]
MKRKLIAAFGTILGILVVFTSCSAQNAAEKIIGNLTSGTVNLSSGGGQITTSDGALQFGDNLKWPGDKMPGIPEMKGKISGIINDNSTGGCSVTYSDVSASDAQAYRDSLKAKGYGNGLESADNDGLLFSGTNSSGEGVMFTYNTSSKDGMVMYTPAQKTAS